MDIKLHVVARSDVLAVSCHLYAKSEKLSKEIRPEGAKTPAYMCDALTALKCCSHCPLIIQWNYPNLLGLGCSYQTGGVVHAGTLSHT